LLGVGCLFIAAASGGIALAPWIWVGLSFGAVGIAYLARRPDVFGKRLDGGIGAARVVVLLPFFALTWGLWLATRIFSRAPPFNEIAPGLWIARRPATRMDLPAGVLMIVDLTAELPRTRGLPRGIAYTCLPTLDGTAPEQAEFDGLVAHLVGARSIYVHCASGHGRSATLAAALLIARGVSASVPAAEERIRAARPGVRLSRAQRAFLERRVALERRESR
jgi:hypothetical protein